MYCYVYFYDCFYKIRYKYHYKGWRILARWSWLCIYQFANHRSKSRASRSDGSVVSSVEKQRQYSATKVWITWPMINGIGDWLIG